MKLREAIARWLAPEMMDLGQAESMVKTMVEEKVRQAQQAMPINLNYDPKGEGYRKIGGRENLRDLEVVAQDSMLEMAYYLYDTSGLVKRFVRDTRNFCLGEGFTYSVDNDDDKGSAKAVLDLFCTDPMNAIDLRLPKRIEFLGLLGEQCWPVQVDPQSGRVWMSYIDPTSIDQVYVVKNFPEMTAAVKLKGSGGRTGEILPAVRQETDPRQREYGRLVGKVFYVPVNNPPNGPRGRSDLIHLFDFIENFEEGLFDEMDRARQIKNFIWDVTIQGADQDKIREFMNNTPAPKAGSVNAHNEQVTWKAETPDIKAGDSRELYDLMKSYMACVMNRPDSWFGSGGKVYSNEADSMNQPTFKDLADRQRLVKYTLEMVFQFVLDQAIIAGRLHDNLAAPLRAKVEMPEMSAKDMTSVINSLVALASALASAEANSWITQESAARLFASAASQVGVDIDADEELETLLNEAGVTKDYKDRERLINEVVARVENNKAKQDE